MDHLAIFGRSDVAHGVTFGLGAVDFQSSDMAVHVAATATSQLDLEHRRPCT